MKVWFGIHRIGAVVMLFLAMAQTAIAETPAREWRAWCETSGGEAALGWHFYCDPIRDAAEEPPESTAQDLSPPRQADAMAHVATLQQELEESRAVAVLDPTPENVAAYLELQQQALSRAAAFSDAFRRVVWTTPALDYSLTRPVGALAKQLWSDARREERDSALAGLGARYGLIYIGHRACMGCQIFGPLLRAFAKRHGFDVLAVSLDGGPLEGWPEAVPDNGRAVQMGILDGVSLPAVALFDAATGETLPVGFGVLAEDQLAERIFVLTQTEVGDDF